MPTDFCRAIIHYGGFNIDDDYQIIIPDWNYVQRLNKLLKTANPVEVQCYLITRLFIALWNIVPIHEWRELVEIDYSGYCVSLLNQRMPAEVGALYLEEYFSADAQLAINEMVENMRETMIWKISRLDWMSEETKLKAIVKAKQMLFKMGYAEMLTNVTLMDRWSAGFQVQDNNTILQSWIDLVELDFREGM